MGGGRGRFQGWAFVGVKWSVGKAEGGRHGVTWGELEEAANTQARVG